MRHHGKIKEDRRGLAIIVGLLTGIIGGAILFSPAAKAAAQAADRAELSVLTDAAATALSARRS